MCAQASEPCCLAAPPASQAGARTTRMRTSRTISRRTATFLACLTVMAGQRCAQRGGSGLPQLLASGPMGRQRGGLPARAALDPAPRPPRPGRALLLAAHASRTRAGGAVFGGAVWGKPRGGVPPGEPRRHSGASAATRCHRCHVCGNQAAGQPRCPLGTPCHVRSRLQTPPPAPCCAPGHPSFQLIATCAPPACRWMSACAALRAVLSWRRCARPAAAPVRGRHWRVLTCHAADADAATWGGACCCNSSCSLSSCHANLLPLYSLFNQ